jgi:catechol 2,3-dioxygenase-like lactoylglutathione lyase family enzyme
MAGIVALHHVQVFYPPGEEAAARRFYGELLGLRELRRPSSLLDRAGIWYEIGTSHVHLSAESGPVEQPRRHFGVRVDDLDAVVARLRGEGARFEDATPLPPWRRVYVFDPFGNKIELDEIH